MSRGAYPEFVLPDRAQVTTDGAFLAACSARLVEVCHRRGLHAMGGMAAQIPVKADAAATEAAFATLRADTLRAVSAGHDGTCVAHPDLVPVVMAVFDAHRPRAHQIRQPRQPVRVDADALLKPHSGKVTEAGLRGNASVAIEYLAQWLSGQGAVPIHTVREVAATAEVARSQIWQWIRHGVDVALEGGGTRRMDADWLAELVQQEIETILARLGTTGFHRGHYASAARIFQDAACADLLPDFITTPAYAVLNALD